MRSSPFWWVFICFMVLLDIYVFQALKVITQGSGHRWRLFIHSAYWFMSASAVVILVLLPYLNFENQSRLFRNTLFACIAGLFFAKVIASLFFLIDDLRRIIQWVAGKIFFSDTEGAAMQEGESISRSVFLSWMGMIAGSGLFGALVYGFNNKYRYQVNRVKLSFQNLPEKFKGTRIVHLSDIHVGSFTDKKAVMKGVEKALHEKPDLILFTGDLVNNKAEEMDDYLDVFDKLSAPLGVYSVLGNHDYGDYIDWESQEEKAENLEKLKAMHKQMGWRLMMNETIALQKEDEVIGLVGIENWSAKARFPKYGDLKKALDGAASYPFKILMSHDPSHWDAEILKSYADIDLTLAGHTHGMQFGVEVPGFRWSPVQYVYRQWAGLYEKGKQKLYVNRGFGFIGYPGRVGILPEITVIELA